jgi:Zn-dependent protease with chaperone function
MQLKGWLYNGESSQRYAIYLTCSDEGVFSWRAPQCNIENSLIEDTLLDAKITPPKLHRYTIDQLKFSSRVGNTPRFINFPDQFRFETSDNNEVDALLKTFANSGQLKLSIVDKWAHKLEASKRFILSAVTLTTLSCWIMVQYGIPYFSKELAQVLPIELATHIGSGSLEVLDESIMSPSELPEARVQQLTSTFAALLPTDQESIPFKLVFRKSELAGANAFALPSGTIIFTDEMIELAENDDELRTIMLHEIGHVVNRHSLRHVIQQSGLALIVMLITGDASTSSALILAIPGLLLEASYSQAIEYEADTYALEHLETHNIAPAHFVAIMKRLEKNHQQAIKDKDDTDIKKQLSDYFSSHPPTTERLKRFTIKPVH